MSSKIWAIRAGTQDQADRLFLQDGHIALSFSEIGEEIANLPASADLENLMGVLDGSRLVSSAIPLEAGQIYRFVHEMRIGDRVIYPRKADRTLHWGEICGPYVVSPDPDGFVHRRNVLWRRHLSRDLFSHGALYELGSTLTLFEVKSFADEFRRKFESAGEAAPGSASPDTTDLTVLHDIGETTRDFISKKMKANLKGFPMEHFIADLFRAMGYRAHATRKVRDDGIDVIAHRDELGIEPPVLKIQVKSQEANIGSDAVKAFSAMVQERDVGIFVATGGYTSGALDFAKNRSNLRLVDGIELVELVQKYYDLLDSKYRQLIPLRRVLVPDSALETE